MFVCVMAAIYKRAYVVVILHAETQAIAVGGQTIQQLCLQVFAYEYCALSLAQKLYISKANN